MPSWFEEQAEQYSFNKDWQSLITSTLGQEIQDGSRRRNDRRKFGSGIVHIDARAGYAKNPVVRLPSRPNAIDKLMAGVASRFSYLDLQTVVAESVDLARDYEHGKTVEGDVENDYFYRIRNMLVHNQEIAQQVELMLAVRNGADHFNAPEIIDNARMRLQDSFYGKLNRNKTAVNHNLNQSIVENYMDVVLRAYDKVLSSEQCMKCTKSAFDHHVKHIRRDPSAFNDNTKSPRSSICNQVDYDHWEHTCTDLEIKCLSYDATPSLIFTGIHKSKKIVNDQTQDIIEMQGFIGGYEDTKFAESMWGAVAIEVAGGNSQNPYAEEIANRFFIKNPITKEYISNPKDISWAMVFTCVAILDLMMKAKPKDFGLDNSQYFESRNQERKENTFQGTQNPDWIQRRINCDNTDAKRNSELLFDDSKENDLLTGTKFESMTEERMELIDNMLSKEIELRYGTDEDEEERADLSEPDAWEHADFDYLRGGVLEKETANYKTYERLVIEEFEPTTVGDEELELPVSSINGMPTHKAWQIPYGNMEVFTRQDEESPELVILLDNSASMLWGMKIIGRDENNYPIHSTEPYILAWSVAMTIKNTYPKTRIYPYSSFGVFTGEIDVGKRVPILDRSGTPTERTLLWLADKLFDRLDRTNVLLISDDEQGYGVGDVCSYLRQKESMSLGLVQVGHGTRNWMRDFPSDFSMKIRSLEDIKEVRSIVDRVTAL